MNGTSTLAYIVIILAIGYSFIYPSMGEISSLLSQKQKYQNSLEMVASIENRKNELLSQFNKISAEDKKDIETILPNSLNFVRLVSQIDAVAAKYGISIDKISAKEMGSSVGDSIEGAEPPKVYKSSVIGFSFTSPYDKFSSFINDLEKSLRLLDIKSLKLAVQEGGVYAYTIEFETYWLE